MATVRLRRKSNHQHDPGPKEEDEKRLSKMKVKWEKVAKEILDTELTYQKHLELIVLLFENPLRLRSIIPSHVVATIFSNVRQLINVNEELWNNLNTLSIGKAFLQIGPFLKLYSTYAKNHERALATLLDWEQKSEEFSVFRRSQEELPEMNGLKLNALLITPVQRVPRYKLLLEELLHNTTKDDKDYSDLQEALKQISEVASHINDHIKQQDNFMKMLAIQKTLVGAGAPKILTPGRIFIKEGTLNRVSKNGARSYERKFFLFSDMLMYAKPKPLEPHKNTQYTCCCIFPLNHCKAERLLGTSQAEGALFTVSCKKETLLLYGDQECVNSWLEALQKAIGVFQEKRRTLRKPSSVNDPIRRTDMVRVNRLQHKPNDLGKTASQDMLSPEKSHFGIKKRLRSAMAEVTSATICVSPRSTPTGSRQNKRKWTPTISSPTPESQAGIASPRDLSLSPVTPEEVYTYDVAYQSSTLEKLSDLDEDSPVTASSTPVSTVSTPLKKMAKRLRHLSGDALGNVSGTLIGGATSLQKNLANPINTLTPGTPTTNSNTCMMQ